MVEVSTCLEHTGLRQYLRNAIPLLIAQLTVLSRRFRCDIAKLLLRALQTSDQFLHHLRNMVASFLCCQRNCCQFGICHHLPQPAVADDG